MIPSHTTLVMENNQKLHLALDQGSLSFDVNSSVKSIYRIYTFKSKDFDFKINSDTLQRIVDALYLLCLESDIGILINPNLKSGGISNYFREKLISENDFNIEEDFIGVMVVPSKTKFLSLNPATLTLGKNLKKFEDLLNKYVGLKYQRSEKLLRAIEIYNSSTYLTILNKSGRFILQMTAVEALIEQKDVSKRLQNSLNSYIKRIRKLKIINGEKDSISGSLDLLKKVSISRSGRYLVDYLLPNDKMYNGFKPSVFFRKAYDLRSKFVHYGKTETKYLNINSIQMDGFVRDLLKSYFEKNCCENGKKFN